MKYRTGVLSKIPSEFRYICIGIDMCAGSVPNVACIYGDYQNINWIFGVKECIWELPSMGGS